MLSLPSVFCTPDPAHGVVLTTCRIGLLTSANHLEDPLCSEALSFLSLDPAELITINHQIIFLQISPLKCMLVYFKLKCMCDMVRDTDSLKCGICDYSCYSNFL